MIETLRAKAWQTARHIRHRFEPHAIILLYHRVVELALDPQLLAVTPQHFAEHLDIVRRYRPMRLQSLNRALSGGRLPRRAVVVTFDDGYADNLYNAKPLLERYDLPATVFVTAGQVGQTREFWWDDLERLVLQPGPLPERLELQVNGRVVRWEPGRAADGGEEAYQRYADWHIERRADPGPRQQLYRALYDLLHGLTAEERRTALDKLCAWAGADSAGRLTHRALTAAEVAQLADGDLLEVGAHTMTHSRLAALSIKQQQEEICRSKDQLEGILNRPVLSLAYPHGSYTAETLGMVQDAGLACACSSDANAVWRNADRWQLPRVVMRNWDGDEFARWLGGWFGR